MDDMILNPMQSTVVEIDDFSPNDTAHLKETSITPGKKIQGMRRLYLQRFFIVFVLTISIICIDLLVAFYHVGLGENNSVHINLDTTDSSLSSSKYQLQDDNDKGAIKVDGNFNVKFNPLLSQPRINNIICDIMYENQQALSIFVGVSLKHQKGYVDSEFKVAIHDFDYSLTRKMLREVGLHRKENVILQGLCSVDGALRLFSSSYLSVPIVVHKTKFDIPLSEMVHDIVDHVLKASNQKNNIRNDGEMREPKYENKTHENNDDTGHDDNDTQFSPAEALKTLTPSWLENFPQAEIDTFNHRKSKVWWKIPLLQGMRRSLLKLGICSFKISVPTLDYSFKFEGLNFTAHDMDELRKAMENAYNISSDVAAKSFNMPSILANWSAPDFSVILADLSELHGLIHLNSSSNTIGTVDLANDNFVSIGFTVKCSTESSMYCNIFTPALMPTLGKLPEIKMHTDSVDFITSLMGPYHHVSKTADDAPNEPTKSSSSLRRRSNSRRLDELDVCDTYDIDGVAGIASCDSKLAIFDDGGEIVKVVFSEEFTHIFSDYLLNSPSSLEEPDVAIIDMRIDHLDGLFNGDMRAQNFKVIVTWMGININMLGNASALLFDDRLEVNILGREAERVCHGQYVHHYDACDVRDVGKPIYGLQSSTNWGHSEDVLRESSFYDESFYYQEFRIIEKDAEKKSIFMMNHSLQMVWSDDEKKPSTLEYKYQIPDFDVSLDVISSIVHTASEFDMDAAMYFTVESTEVFRLSPSVNYKDFAENYNSTCNFLLTLTTSGDDTLFSMGLDSTLDYPNDILNFAGALYLDGPDEEIFRLTPTFHLVDKDDKSLDAAVQFDVNSEKWIIIGTGYDIIQSPSEVRMNGAMYMEDGDAREIFRLSPAWQLDERNDRNKIMLATLRVMMDGDHEIASVHTNSSLSHLTYTDMSNNKHDHRSLISSTSFSVESEEVFRISPWFSADTSGIDDWVEFNMEIPLYLSKEKEEPELKLLIYTLARHWHDSWNEAININTLNEANLYQLESGNLTLILPKSDPDFSLLILEGSNVALKRDEKMDMWSGWVFWSNTYMGASWFRIGEALEGSISGVHRVDKNKETSVMEIGMDIDTVDVSMAMLMDFENLYMTMDMQADESADWSMTGGMAIQIKPMPSALDEISTDFNDGIVTYAAVSMSLDEDNVMDPYEYGELRSVEPFDRQEMLDAPLDFTWVNTTTTSINIKFEARDCPVNPRPIYSNYKDVFDFKAGDILVAKNVDGSYVVNIEGFRRYFSIPNVSMKAVFINNSLRQRSYGHFSNLNADTDPIMFTQVITSDPVAFNVQHIRLKLYDASKPKGSKRVLSCIDLVL